MFTRRATRRLRWLLMLVVLLGSSCRRVEGPPSAGQAARIITTKSGVEMVLIPAGRFMMGSRTGQDDESPVHEVWVDAFWMDRTEVTQADYDKLVKGNPAHFKGPDRPMEMIRWADAALYCNKRSRAEGLEPCYDEATAGCNFDANGYRLPTEAEWEYACRAGTDTDYHFGHDPHPLTRYAWFADNGAKQTHPVAKKQPNPWGLFDVYGNVAEWCNDVYDNGYYKICSAPCKDPRGPADGDKYVLRGGAWNVSAKACRSAYRVGEDPGFQDACFARDAIGFRCARRAAARLDGTRPEG